MLAYQLIKNSFRISSIVYKKFSTMATKSALIIGSNGSEDIELIVTSDILRRAGTEFFMDI
jgi:hypothetical protein